MTLLKNLLSILSLVSVISIAPFGVCTALESHQASETFDAFHKAFWDKSSRQYVHSTTDKSLADFWCMAEMIETIEDKYQRFPTSETKQLITEAYEGFNARFGTDWTKNPYNDDVMWMILATVRAYSITNNSDYLSQAQVVFDAIWARAYDDSLGGGLWWNTSKHEKNTCINAPAGIAALYLFRATKDPSYLEKAIQLHEWLINNMWDPISGSVWDHKSIDGTIDRSNYTYNQGTFLGLSHQLHQITGDAKYFKNAILAAEYTRSELRQPGTDMLKNEDATPDQPGFKGIFARYLAMFAKENNLTNLLLWLEDQADTLFNHRDTNGLISDHFAEFSRQPTITSWGASSAVVLMLVAPERKTLDNLTLHAPTFSNGSDPSFDAAKATDGEVIGDSKWIGTAEGDKWLTVDLGKAHLISRWEVQHAGCQGEPTRYNTADFTLEYSNDNSTWYLADAVMGNKADQTIRSIKPFRARYVRLYITRSETPTLLQKLCCSRGKSDTLARIYEFEVFG